MVRKCNFIGFSQVLILFTLGCRVPVVLPTVTQSQTYILSQIIDLQGKVWRLPNNTIIQGEQKGLLKNGIVVGDSSSLINVQLSNVKLSGNYKDLDITLLDDTDTLILHNTSFQILRINGNRHNLGTSSFGIIRNCDIRLYNISFDCKNAKNPFLYSISSKKNNFVVENCQFKNIPEIELLIPRGMQNPTIRNCTFEGKVTPKVKRKQEKVALIRFYSCYGNVIFEGNTVSNCFGIAVDGIGFSEEKKNTLSVKNNVIRNVTNGGIVFNGGIVHNAVVEANHISNVFCFGKQSDKENGWAENAAINFHGFKKLVIRDNTIDNCIHSSAIDLDGTLSTDVSVRKGENVEIEGNTFNNIISPILYGVSNANIKNNNFIYIEDETSTGSESGLIINSCDDVKVNNNSFTVADISNREIYPIIVRQKRGRTSGKIEIKDNCIRTNGSFFLKISKGFTGILDMMHNDTESTTTGKPLKVMDYTK